MTCSAKKLQNRQPLGKRQEETLGVVNAFICHYSLLDEYLSMNIANELCCLYACVFVHWL